MRTAMVWGIQALTILIIWHPGVARATCVTVCQAAPITTDCTAPQVDEDHRFSWPAGAVLMFWASCVRECRVLDEDIFSSTEVPLDMEELEVSAIGGGILEFSPIADPGFICRHQVYGIKADFEPATSYHVDWREGKKYSEHALGIHLLSITAVDEPIDGDLYLDEQGLNAGGCAFAPGDGRTLPVDILFFMGILSGGLLSRRRAGVGRLRS